MSDWWASDPPASGGPLRVTVGGPQGDAKWWENDAPADNLPGVVKAGREGLISGAAGLVGLSGELANLKNLAVQKGAKFIGDRIGIDVGAPKQSMLPTPTDVRGAIENTTGVKPYTPQGKVEEYVRTLAEFAPGAAIGPGGPLARLIQVAIPAVASETAGQVTKGTGLEPAARFGGAMTGAGITALASRPSGAARALRDQLPPGITEQHVNQAHQLMQDAAQQGIRLTWPEALSQVAQRPVLTNTLRHLEASPQTEARMGEVFAGRPQAVEGAVRQQADNIVAQNPHPSSIGPQVGEAAEEYIQGVNNRINTVTRPLYRQAEQTVLDPGEFARVSRDPVFQEGLRRVRADPFIGPQLEGHADNSWPVLDAVYKQLDETGQALRNPMSGTAQSNYSSSIAGQGANRAQYASDIASGSIPAQVGPLAGNPNFQGVAGFSERARAQQAQLREQYLNPLKRGYLGKLADKDQTTKAAMDALFPQNPLAGSADEIDTAVRALVSRNAMAARDLVRAHIESVFAQSAKDLQSGANQAGGAKFRAALVGNQQQAANLEAAVRALPHGDQVWAGFNRMLDVLEATGTRQNIGSKTAYNAEALRNQSASGMVGETAKGVANPLRGFQFLADRYERYRLGANLNELADILTRPDAVNQLRAIARMPVGGGQARNTTIRLLTAANTEAQSVNQRGNQQRSPEGSGNR